MRNLFVFMAVATILLASSNSWAYDKKVFENAVGFMIGGDDMYDDVTSYSSDGCTMVVKFAPGDGAFIKMTWNFDLAYWKSARTYTKNGSEYFAVNGDKGVYVGESKGLNVFILKQSGVELGSKKTAEFGMPNVTMERFLNAARDLRKQCPGKRKTAY